jgi:hypothetical protein
MLRAGVRTVKAAPAALCAIALVATTLTAAGCFARRYPALMEKHLEVLSLYASKLSALAQDEHTVPAQDWGEFTYPLERAREFARVARARYPDRDSLREFEAALAAYAALVDDPAVLSSRDAVATITARAAAFAGAAAATRAALAREAAG